MFQLITAPSSGKLSLEVIHMESTYSDRKQQPATLEDLKRMAEEVKQLF